MLLACRQISQATPKHYYTCASILKRNILNCFRHESIAQLCTALEELLVRASSPHGTNEREVLVNSAYLRGLV